MEAYLDKTIKRFAEIFFFRKEKNYLFVMMLEVKNKYMYLLNMGKQLIESERININLIELIQSQNL